MKRGYHVFVIAFWVGLSLFFMGFSYKYGLGKLNNPGPGLMPFLIGAILFFISISQLLRSFWGRMGKTEVIREKRSKENIIKVGMVFVSLFVYALFLETLGYVVGTFLLLMVLFWCAGFKKWSHVFMLSVLTALATYLIFSYLEVRFPMGIIRLFLYRT